MTDTAMSPDYLAPWRTIRAPDGGVIAYVHPRADPDLIDRELRTLSDRPTPDRQPDPGQRYRLSPEAGRAISYCEMTGKPLPYLHLDADGVTLDPCPPADNTTPDSPAQPAEHSQPDYAPADNPAGSAADPSTTTHPAATPNHSAPTKSSADTPAETPSTPATSEPRTGAATAEAAPASPTGSKQPDEQPQPDETGPRWSWTTGDHITGDHAADTIERIFSIRLDDWQRSILRAAFLQRHRTDTRCVECDLPRLCLHYVIA